MLNLTLEYRDFLEKQLRESSNHKDVAQLEVGLMLIEVFHACGYNSTHRRALTFIALLCELFDDMGISNPYEIPRRLYAEEKKEVVITDTHVIRLRAISSYLKPSGIEIFSRWIESPQLRLQLIENFHLSLILIKGK
jgi:hypothetical protein